MVACGFVGLAILFTPALFRPLLGLSRRRGKLGGSSPSWSRWLRAYRERLGVIALALGLAMLGHAMYVLAFYLADRGLFGAEAPGLAVAFPGRAAGPASARRSRSRSGPWG